jgi:beta-lactamase class D
MLRAAFVLLALVTACGPPLQPRAAAPSGPVAPTPPKSSSLPTIDWARHGLASEGCFSMRDLATGEERINDASRCARPRRPNSTFKIPNALIALDLGILDGPDSMMRWDPVAYPAQDYWSDEWKRDHTLRSAVRVSAVPLFRALAIQIGPERMRGYLERLDYGNRDMSGGPDAFWLRGGLRITARQQIELLSGLVQRKLPVKAEAQAAMRDVLRLEPRHPGVELFGKTGSGSLEDGPEGPTGEGPMVGWMVGWIEQAQRTVVYAMWIEGESYQTMRERRTKAVDAVIDDLVGVEPR